MTDQRLLGRVARLYYEEGLTHADIASVLGVSRVKVTRLVAEARREGVVEITVHSDEPVFAELEQRLSARFDLAGAWVAPAAADGAHLGRAGGRALRSLLPTARRVTLGQGASVRDAILALDEAPSLELPQLDVFPFGGGRTGRASGEDSSDVAAALARTVGGSVYGLHAPLIAHDAESARALASSPDLQHALTGAAGADLVVVGAGGLKHSRKFLAAWIPEETFAALEARGAVGDISARFFDADGASVPSDLDTKVVGLTIEQMRAIPTRVVIAGGMDKIEAIRGVVGNGLANALVTDAEVAEALLR